jgi:S1-C subfamily serine protease
MAGKGRCCDGLHVHMLKRADVITDNANVKVTLGQDEYMATVVGVDQDRDIAVLKVGGLGLIVQGP